jgi:hypothetical protein
VVGILQQLLLADVAHTLHTLDSSLHTALGHSQPF